MADGVRSIAMLARDWDLLNELLPSTWSMITYTARRARLLPRCPLGSEPDVFALLIEHENSDQPIAIPAGGLAKDYFDQVQLAHPEWFLGGEPNDRFSFVIDSMIEGAADFDPDLSSEAEALTYLRVIEFLDRIPLLLRVRLGKKVVEHCEKVGREGGSSSFRAAVPGGMFVFYTDGDERHKRAGWLKSLTEGRHSQALDAGASPSLVTLGVSTQPLPSPDGGRAHDYVMMQGPIRSDPAFRKQRDQLFGAQDMAPLIEHWNGRGR